MGDQFPRQQRNNVLFSLETESSNLWFVKCSKMRKKLASIFFQKASYYSILSCKK